MVQFSGRDTSWLKRQMAFFNRQEYGFGMYFDLFLNTLQNFCEQRCHPADLVLP